MRRKDVSRVGVEGKRKGKGARETASVKEWKGRRRELVGKEKGWGDKRIEEGRNSEE